MRPGVAAARREVRAARRPQAIRSRQRATTRRTSAQVREASAAAARSRASASTMRRTAYLISGTKFGATLTASKPMPKSSTAIAGSLARSPHTELGFPASRQVRAMRCSATITAGCCGS